MANILHILENDGVKFGCMLPENSYDNISTIVGITPGDATSIPDHNTTTGALVRGGEAGRIAVTLVDGSKLKTRRILCSAQKMSTAVGALPGNTYNGLTIRSARFPRRMRLG